MIEVVSLLISDGVVCQTIGHKWESGCGMNNCLVMHYGQQRHCILCGKSESRNYGEWK